MQILLVEGIPTSGKTTISQKIAKLLENHKIQIIDENITWMPLIDNTKPQIALDFLQTKIAEFENLDTDFLIIDRLHLTHIFKTKPDLEFFVSIENWLVERVAKLVLLNIREDQISKRIEQSFGHRDTSWQEYVSKKGTAGEITTYYQNQQEILLQTANVSKLNHFKIDRTNSDFDRIATEIVNFWAPNKLFPLVAAGALIFDEENKVFLMQSSGKFGAEWIVPGGKVAFGETVEMALAREIKEETNLNLTNIEFIGYRDYIKTEKHFIFLEFCVKTTNSSEVKLNYEATKYGFFGQYDLAKLEIAKPTLELIQTQIHRIKK
jgi:ADP-ribose pyrophosphatase YjhB (NUDIX family)